MALKLTKQKTIALLMVTLSFMTLAQSVSSARMGGVDLSIQKIKFDHNAETGEMVNFAVFVKNKGTEPTQALGLKFDFGSIGAMGFAAPIVIEPGETRVFNLGTTYMESGKFIVKATVSAHPEDVNLRNNIKTAIINIG